MPFHILTARGLLPIAFTRVEDAYVYALVRGGPGAADVGSWGLVDHGPAGDQVVVPPGQLAAQAARWRGVAHSRP